jgi:hypothetical protein
MMPGAHWSALPFEEAADFGAIAALAHGAPASQVIATGVHKKPIACVAITLTHAPHFFRSEQFRAGEGDRPKYPLQSGLVVPINLKTILGALNV